MSTHSLNLFPTLFSSIFSSTLLACLSVSVALSGTVYAATTTEDASGIRSEEFLFAKVPPPAGSVKCFDYYHFGSVQVDASPIFVTNITPGKPITFKGKIKNDNPYPIVDGQVYVKIFKKDKVSDQLLMINSYPIIDFLLAKDSVAIAGNTEQDIAFDWNVPSSANGEYQAAFYFTSAHRYNLLGLSFTDDVTGNKADFSVKGTKGAPSPVIFDKNSIFLNKNPYHPATFLQHFTKDEPVTTYVTLKNSENVSKDVEVTWITSKWDGILASHEQKRETMKVTLKPKESQKISYIVPLVASSVTFLQAEVKDGDAKSMLHIRFARNDYDEVRINFPSIMKYPLVEGQDTTLFSCVHSTNLPVVEGNTLTLTLKDEQGDTLHAYTYTGSVTGDMMGVKDSFVPKKSLSTFSLTAKLEHKGNLVEEVTMKYDCLQIDKSLCQPKELIGATTSGGAKNNVTMISIIAISLLALGGASSAYYIKRKRSSGVASVAEPEKTTPEGEVKIND